MIETKDDFEDAIKQCSRTFLRTTNRRYEDTFGKDQRFHQKNELEENNSTENKRSGMKTEKTIGMKLLRR